MPALTPSYDQLQVFLAVVDEGSFSAAARSLKRAQSAVTYAIQKLEEQLDVRLFDRAAYRPALTEAGRALLPRARLVADEMQALRNHAEAIAAGAEPELRLVVDAMFPMDRLVESLRLVSARFPHSPPRIYVDSMGAAAELVLNGVCAIGLLLEFSSVSEHLQRDKLIDIAMIPVAAPNHPLGAADSPVSIEDLRPHVQLVLSDRSGLSGDRDYGVFSTRTWRIADLGAKHAMLKAGLGWGSLPAHLVAEDLANGRLRRLTIRDEAGLSEVVRLPLCSAFRRDRPPGPAGRHLLAHLSAGAARKPA
ncbi:LysR family transcriptional regulator [Methylocella silvestris]|uniref:LysR family transcriptional regulator n=1 Tax=Methylocella silvestris TaxID=199596 RepID=A0A2J7TKZ1_METSI|nr:LysR family transcriptional regulator [Methylocella silvestris]PNG27434.1 LysR family transcriptional regulator [Methylocella silvestris]